MQLPTSVARQLAADGVSHAGVRDRRRRGASIAADVRSDGLHGQASTTDRVHRRLHLQQRMVDHRDVLRVI